MLLSSYLKRENNNLEIVRIVAACMVIYGHAYAISPEIGSVDIIQRLVGFEYSGSMAVKIFFFISGLVVTNSFYKKRNIQEFIVSRFFRIWPGLIALTIISYLIGIFASSLDATDFIKKMPFASYFTNSIILDVQWIFPGVFDNNNLKIFNGSLWTIGYEVAAYIVLMSSFVLLRFNRAAILLACILVLFDSSILNGILFKLASENEELKYLPSCFSLGAIFAILKDKIEINLTTILILIPISYILYYQKSQISHVVFYATIMYSILYISSIKKIVALKIKNDISYGIYLWGFPIQQLVATQIPNHGVLLNQIVSILLSIIVGFISWKLIESKGISVGKRFSIQAP